MNVELNEEQKKKLTELKKKHQPEFNRRVTRDFLLAYPDLKDGITKSYKKKKSEYVADTFSKVL